jgi:hypothetical protein
MTSIQYAGQAFPSRDILIYANSIKDENYKTSTVKQFQRRFPLLDGMSKLIDEIALRINGITYAGKGLYPLNVDLEPVFFSVAKGAAEHTDELDRDIYTDVTIVIPLVVPKGLSELTVGGNSINLQQFGVYLFDHTKPHKLVLEDNESGCTVLMIAIKK